MAGVLGKLRGSFSAMAEVQWAQYVKPKRKVLPVRLSPPFLSCKNKIFDFFLFAS